QRAVALVADVIAASIRSSSRPVVHFDAADFSHHFISHRIDDRDIISGAIGLEDANCASGQGQCEKESEIFLGHSHVQSPLASESGLAESVKPGLDPDPKGRYPYRRHEHHCTEDLYLRAHGLRTWGAA